MKIKTLVKSLALTAGLAASFTASADFVEFTVDEGNGSLVTADKINGGYVERITFDGAGNFSASAFATFGQFFLGSNSLNTGLNNTYSLYATFNADGYADSDGNVDFFVGESGGFSIFMDPNNDTVLSDEDDVASVVGNGEDMLLGSSSTIGNNVGTSTTINGQTITAFQFDFMNFELEVAGEEYFVSPTPFSMMVNVNGDFDAFAQAGTQITRGDVSAQFYEVPEPSTIAVMALGLLGLGAARRRK